MHAVLHDVVVYLRVVVHGRRGADDVLEALRALVAALLLDRKHARARAMTGHVTRRCIGHEVGAAARGQALAVPRPILLHLGLDLGEPRLRLFEMIRCREELSVLIEPLSDASRAHLR